MRLPLVDLKAQYRGMAAEINAAISRVLERGDFILGQDVAEFEREFAEYTEARYCVGVASGTDALCLALRALNIGPGDEVLVPVNTYIATALAVTQVGARPVLVDARSDTYNIAADQLDARVTKRARAIIPVHLYGQSADMDAVEAFAARRGLAVVEDACQSHGARHNGRRCGSIGVAGCFSFYPGKNLGAYGDGGAVVTSDEGLAEKIRLLRNYGQKVKYEHQLKGGNSRLDTLQAAILRVKLRKLDAWTRRRIGNARLYGQYLEDVAELELPAFEKAEEFSHVFHLYVVRARQRDGLLNFLRGKEVFCGIHYPIPIHLQEAYKDLGHVKGDFPVAEKAAREIISLPMYPELTEEDIRYIAESIKQFYAGSR